jgi:hypothetical protein
VSKVDERGLVELEHLARDLHMLLKRIDTRGDFMRNAGLQDQLHRVRPAIVIGALLYIKGRMATLHHAVPFDLTSFSCPFCMCSWSRCGRASRP